MSDDAEQQWKTWHARRVETVSAPYGPLSLTGTHWLADAVEGRLPDIAGRWADGGDAVVLSAGSEAGLTVDGRPLDGEVRLGRDTGEAAESRVAYGDRRLVVLRRDDLWAVRVFDPQAPGRLAFGGIEATAYDPDWVVPAVFRPYGESRTVRVASADGLERGLGVGGELAFGVGGQDHTLQAAVEDDGSLWIVFSDATSGHSSYRFRFLRPPAPAADHSVTLDFNRALLPPCAFAEHFICPFPPPGNSLAIAVPAGERKSLSR
ncbi:DUF1684 domain-containing protein [Streptomyces pathocidini]|uniref:DUF1684 domain-containing protein n=1 Tax=Streptomyces pathocidini TaxID=1650571 RepID=UPI0033FE9732